MPNADILSKTLYCFNGLNGLNHNLLILMEIIPYPLVPSTSNPTLKRRYMLCTFEQLSTTTILRQKTNSNTHDFIEKQNISTSSFK